MTMVTVKDFYGGVVGSIEGRPNFMEKVMIALLFVDRA